MHLTRRAVLLFLLAAPLLAAGTWLPFMQWVGLAYAAACVALVIADARLAEPLARLDVQRTVAQKLNLGAANKVTLSIFQRGARPLTFWLRDEPPDDFDVQTRILSGTAASRQKWQGDYHVTPLRRGDYQFGDLTLRWQGPLGLCVRQARIAAAGPVKVYPNLLDIQRYDLLLRRHRLQEMGLRQSRQRGEGTEFERLREYVPDDDYRKINWPASARNNRPISTEYETERSQNIFLVLDTGRMMQSPVERIAKLDYAVNATLLLAYVAVSKGDKVGVMTFADDVSAFLSPQPGRGQFYRALEVLYAVRPSPVEPDYYRAFSYLALKQRRRSLIVLFTDLTGVESMQALVRQMVVLQRTSLPLVVTISDPDILAAASQSPQDSLSAYQRSAAARLLDDRRLALDHLRRQGVLTLDSPANQLSAQVINHYLDLKARTLL